MPVCRRKPTRYERLHERVYRALDSANRQVHGGEGCVFGIGDPNSPLCAWCPACRRGTVAVWLIETWPPGIDVDGCDAGCTALQVAEALRS